MREDSAEGSKELNRNFLISQLTNPETDLEERISLTEQLFPEERRFEMTAKADKDIHDRPTRFFRLMTYDELNALLNFNERGQFQNPAVEEIFSQKSEKNKNYLKHFLEENGLYDSLASDFEELSANFTLQNCQNFLQTKIPKGKLLDLQILSNFHVCTGFNSLSVGAPYQPPYEPNSKRDDVHKGGMPVVEFRIPAEDITVFPNRLNIYNREMEKEVCTVTLKPEWIATIYNGSDDFANRFVRDPQSVLYQKYVAAKELGKLIGDYASGGQIFDMLQEWKREESIDDLIPASRIGDLDDNNPDLEKPFRVEK